MLPLHILMVTGERAYSQFNLKPQFRFKDKATDARGSSGSLASGAQTQPHILSKAPHVGTCRTGVLWPLRHEADRTLRLPGGQLGNELRLLPNLPTMRLSPRNSPVHALKPRPHSTGGCPVAIPSSDVASGLSTIPRRTSIGRGTQRRALWAPLPSRAAI